MTVSRETHEPRECTVPGNVHPWNNRLCIPGKGTVTRKWTSDARYATCDHGYRINADVYHDGEWMFGIAIDNAEGHTCPTAEWMAILNEIIEMES